MSRIKKAKKGGKPIKLSYELIEFLDRKRKDQSYDQILRKIFGLPTREGEKQPVKVFYALTNPKLAVFDNLADARGEAMIRAAMNGKRKTEKPIKMKEYV